MRGIILRIVELCVIPGVLCPYFSVLSEIKSSNTSVSIETYEELKEFASGENGKETDPDAKLTDDTDFKEEKEWIPIGSDADHAYTGVFDGNGHSIFDLSNSKLDDKPDCSGLFGYIGIAGIVKDITVKSAQITTVASDASDEVRAGAPAGRN